MKRIALMLACLAAAPATAQDAMQGLEGLLRELENSQVTGGAVLEVTPTIETQETRETAVAAPGAVLRVLDRVSGALNDLTLTNGQTTGFGRIEITLGECRFPAENPSSDAYAYVTIRNAGADVPVFEGWMIASSPALNALDHPRYDVWVMRCSRS